MEINGKKVIIIEKNNQQQVKKEQKIITVPSLSDTGGMTQASRDEKQRKTMIYISITIVVVITLFTIWVSLFSVDKGLIEGIFCAASPIEHWKDISFDFFYTLKLCLWSLLISAMIILFLFSNQWEKKEYDPDAVAGSAHWMTQEELKDYYAKVVEPELQGIPVTDPEWYSPNMILSQVMIRSFNMRYTKYNNNQLIIGGSGAGKTRYYIKPNLLNCCGSFIITDPSGEIIASLGNVLKEHNYVIKIVNIHEMRYSNGYNPFEYIHDEKGIGEIIDCFIRNTNKNENGGGDEFFENAERMLYAACICLLVNHIEDKSLKNFGTVVKLVNMSEVDETGQTQNQSKLDMIFNQLPYDALAVKFYRAFKQGSGRTTKSIIISCLTRLQPFMYSSVHNLTQYDDLELEKIGDRKTALFLITPQEKGPYNFLTSMLYQQVCSTIYEKGERQLAEGGDPQMKYHIRFLMDEFANLGGIIPGFPSKLSTMRKYNMSASIILQDKQQIEAMYPNNYLELIGNCDSKIYLGGGALETQEWISKMLGTATVISSSTNGVGGNQKSTKSYTKTKRELLNADEVDLIDPDQCIIKTKNIRPIIDKKYDYLNHPLYNFTGDADESKKFLYRKMALYDNLNAKHKVNMLQAEDDLKEYVARQKISDGIPLNQVKLDGGSLEGSEDALSLNNAIQRGMELFAPVIMRAVPIIEMDRIIPRIVSHVLYMASETYGGKTPLVILHTISEDMYNGYMLDNEEETMYSLLAKSQYAIYDKTGQEGKEVLEFKLKRVNKDNWAKEINHLLEEEINEIPPVETTETIRIE